MFHVDFMDQQGDSLFPEAPVIIPINEEEHDWTSKSRKQIILLSQIDADGTLQNALKLFPETKRIVIILGKDDSHAPFYDRLMKAIDQITDEIEIEDTSDLTYEEMLQYVSSLPDDSIALYGPYFEDLTGRSFVPAEVASKIANIANTPVFALREEYVYRGLAGGSVISTVGMSELAAKAGLDYLSGKIQLDQQTKYIDVDNYLLFDWKLLIQLGANPKVLPNNTVFLNHTPSIWETYRELCIAIGLFITALMVLVVLLLITNRQKKSTLERLTKSDNELQIIRDYQNNLIQNSNAPIITWSPEYIITEFNRAFEKLTGRNRDEVLGQNMETLFFDDDITESMNLIYRATSGTNLESKEIPIRDVSGRIYNVIWSSANLKNPKGEKIATVAQGQDITQRKRAAEDLLHAYDSTIIGWAHALELKDHNTGGHCKRVEELTIRIAKRMCIKQEEIIHVRRGAFLHDIGKMGIPDNILTKPSKLTDEEWEIMQKHPVYAFEMLSSIDFLYPALDIPYCHHEKWDGSGYPRGLSGEEIPFAARIFAIVDVYDALTNDRPYHKACTEQEAIEQIKEQSGKHFDPQVVAVFLDEVCQKTAFGVAQRY